MRNDTSTTLIDPQFTAALGALVQERGILRAAEFLGVTRETLLRLRSGSNFRRGSYLVAVERLRELGKLTT